ncbi:MAG: dihydrofolate reductase, partial [Alphaproteobacteria bacterium]|nr:dihydrofolate reductase [Alphaproteobacteria bacterium]
MNKPTPLTISAIVAMARNRVIGNAGALPWRLSGDLKFFKATTLGKPVVMGRKTYESIGRPLPGRPNIVITRDRGFSAEGITVVHDIDAALAEADRQARAIGAAEIMI